MEKYPNSAVEAAAQDEVPDKASFNLREYLIRCTQKWPLFLISLALCCVIGTLYYLREQPVYTRTMSVLIKDQDSGTSADISNAFSSMGLVASKTNVSNELVCFSSPALMEEVVRRLGLQVDYTEPGRFHPTALYGTTLPVDVELPDLPYDASASFRLELHPDGSVTAHDFVRYEDDKKVEYPKSFRFRTGFQAHRSPLGRLIVRPAANFQGHLTEDMTIEVRRSSLRKALDTYSDKLTVTLHDKDSDVIDLTVNDVNTERACAVLDTMLEIYNEDWVKDKNIIAVATSQFIQGRLGVIEKDLGTVDSDISTYKSNNMMPDVEEASNVYLNEAVRTDQEVLDLNNRLAMAKYVRDYLNNPSHRNSVIPANTGIGDLNLEKSISDYNAILLDRNNMAANSSDSNPIVVEYDTVLRGRREAIVKAVNSVIVNLSTSLANTESSLERSRGVIAEAPRQAKDLLSVERQQKVKESLYMFLLQKLEENELTQAFTSYNTRLITPPMGPSRPISPRKMMILGVAVMLGLLIPAIYVFVIMSLDTKIHSKKDLEDVPVPYTGEVPFDKSVSSVKKFRRIFVKHQRRKSDDDDESEKIRIVVSEGNRNVVNESFRVVRNNIDFMTEHKEGRGTVLLVTSFNPGSGKSFTTANLGSSFALKRKKVLLVDGDMRHASLSNICGNPRKGISSYLSGEEDNWEPLVCHVSGHPGLDVLPVGKIPPNPAELLESPRLARLIDEARKDYEYIFLDCPPYNLVVDTMILARFADRSIFVVRAGLLEKSALADVTTLYEEGKLKNMCLVLNGTLQEGSSYYGRKGGYYYYNYYTKD